MVSSSNPGVLIYNGKSYATGLLWFTIQDESDKVLLQQRIKKTQADFYCLRMHISQQQGFGWLNKGHRRGMPVAAAMVADQMVGEWHGVFEADNGWWYMQVRSDTITPNGDQFFATEEEAYNLFQSEMQKHNWPHAYAPEKWRINDPSVRELPLKNLLDEFATTKLVGTNVTAALGGPKQRNMFALGLVGAFILMGGLVAYEVHTSNNITIPAPKPRPVKVVQPATLTVPVNTAEFVSPVQMLRQCGEAADKLLAALPGWRVQTFICGNGKAAMDWQQGNGTITEAKMQGLKTWPQTASISVKDKKLTVSMSLDKLPKLQPEQLLTQEQALLTLEQDFQPLGALQIKPVTPSVPPPPPRGRFDTSPPPPPPPVPPPYLDIAFISGFSPQYLIPNIDAPGLEVVSVDWAVPRGIWQYKFKWSHVKVAAPAAKTATDKNGKPAAGGRK